MCGMCTMCRYGYVCPAYPMSSTILPADPCTLGSSLVACNDGCILQIHPAALGPPLAANGRTPQAGARRCALKAGWGWTKRERSRVFAKGTVRAADLLQASFAGTRRFIFCQGASAGQSPARCLVCYSIIHITPTPRGGSFACISFLRPRPRPHASRYVQQRRCLLERACHFHRVRLHDRECSLPCNHHGHTRRHRSAHRRTFTL